MQMLFPIILCLLEYKVFNLRLLGEEAWMIAVTISQLVCTLDRLRSLRLSWRTSFADIWFTFLAMSDFNLRNWDTPGRYTDFGL